MSWSILLLFNSFAILLPDPCIFGDKSHASYNLHNLPADFIQSVQVGKKKTHLWVPRWDYPFWSWLYVFWRMARKEALIKRRISTEAMIGSTVLDPESGSRVLGPILGLGLMIAVHLGEAMGFRIMPTFRRPSTWVRYWPNPDKLFGDHQTLLLEVFGLQSKNHRLLNKELSGVAWFRHGASFVE